MKRIIGSIGLLALAVAAAGCGKKEAQTVTPRQQMATEVVVWVDQAGITGAQVQREATRLISHVPKDVPADQMPAIQMRLLQQAVDNLVVRQLVKAEMERSGALISQEELEKGKQDLEKGLGEGHSLAMLIAEANVPMAELEDNLRLDLFKNRMTQDQLKAALEAVTEDAVKAYYDGNPDEFTQPEGRLASHILVRVPANADEAAKKDALAKAEGIRKALLEGADFAKLAREASECPLSRARGGALGVIVKGKEAKGFEEAVYGQKIGEVGEVVESPVGFHIIVATGNQEKKVFSFDEVKERLTGMLKSKAQQKVAADYIAQLKDRATIKLDGALAAAVEESKKAAQAAETAGEAPVTAPGAEAPAPAVAQ